MTVTYLDLLGGFCRLGVRKDDAVLIHSSYKSLGPVLTANADGPAVVVRALRDAACAGTVLFPTFSFRFCSTGLWDQRTSPSDMGIITEVARATPGARRTRHPIYSFAVFGQDADALAALDDPEMRSAFGPDSPFRYLMERDGLIVLLGLDYHRSMTFFHHVEEMEGVDYRYPKAFSGTVTYADGTTETSTWSMQVRDWDRGVITSVNPMGALLEAEGVVARTQIGEATVRAMRARDVYRLTKEYLGSARGLLYRLRTPEEAKAWDNEQLQWA